MNYFLWERIGTVHFVDVSEDIIKNVSLVMDFIKKGSEIIPIINVLKLESFQEIYFVNRIMILCSVLKRPVRLERYYLTKYLTKCVSKTTFKSVLASELGQNIITNEWINNDKHKWCMFLHFLSVPAQIRFQYFSGCKNSLDSLHSFKTTHIIMWRSWPTFIHSLKLQEFTITSTF